MNRLEASFALYLEGLLRTGDIYQYGFEEMKFSVGAGAWFTPDFWVIDKNSEITFYETKGFMREAANVRIKSVAGKYPFRFVIVRCVRGIFTFEEV